MKILQLQQGRATEAIMATASCLFFAFTILVFESPFPAAVSFFGIAALVVLCSRPKRLLMALIVYSIIVKFLINDLGFPSMANYVCDALLLLTHLFCASKSIGMAMRHMGDLGYSVCLSPPSGWWRRFPQCSTP